MFVAAPSGGTGGTAWATQPSVRIVDAFGNAASGSATVTLGVSPGSGSGGTLSCTGGQGKATASGLATFAGCRVDLAGAGYTLTATATGLAAATSGAFDVAAGPAVRLVFSGQPGGGTATAAWAAAAAGLAARRRRQRRDRRRRDGDPRGRRPGRRAPASSCTGGLTQPVAAGVVAFTGCALDKAGGGYTLAASSAGLATVVVRVRSR